MDKKNLRLVLDVLVAKGLLTKAIAEEAYANFDLQRLRYLKSIGYTPTRTRSIVQPDVSVIDVLAWMNLKSAANPEQAVIEEDILRAMADHLGMPFVRIDPLKLDSDIVTRGITRPYALRHQIVPLSLVGNTLTVATSNPFTTEGIEGLKQTLQYEVKVVLSPRADIKRIIMEFYGFKSSLAAAQQELSGDFDIGNLEQYVRLKSINELDSSDRHVVKAVEYMLHYAYGQRASDIHIEPKRDQSVVRLRIDGMLHTVHRMPKAVHPAFVTRIKALARLDIAEKRRPQDGRIKTSFEGREVELRVSTLPVSFGEKLVIRIFDPEVLMQDITALGFLERERNLFNAFINAPHGLILVTGPTGSGKTSTLYSTLRSIATPEVNITTIEDPIEMVYEDFNQTAVNTQIGITFASTLRTLMRQDPDIIMVGEIRDFETADNAVQAALTGHLVLSTLHTNDAPSSIARLMDLGVPTYLINASIIGIVAQRLLRKVCRGCISEYPITEDECRMLGIPYEENAERTVVTGLGCSDCRSTGYRGRTGIFEVMDMPEEIKDAITLKAGPEELGRLARKRGFRTLREAAHDRLFSKVTTVDEIIRNLGLSI